MTSIVANVSNRIEMRDIGFGNVIRLNGKAGFDFSTESQSDGMKQKIYVSNDINASVHEDDGADPPVQPGPNWVLIWDTDSGTDGDASSEAIGAARRSIMSHVYEIAQGHDRVADPASLTVVADNVNGVENQRASNSSDHPNQQASPVVPQP